ncbi:hypothetical protein TREMEDRAFT_57956 [Tremella mesenterica DSM 1558]|uniref:uncharacterized protein n=1 Tax=Tremella mesenterica (strain ATCC 24925 / CBS 8224 / DSM 1558 / NBRC 9311 / NRRL Y-6157 / RJB 2259-6 / UBC 559-6) TaxID=578456 RepID=UPI00032D34C4|nr:uncharacterized protein TREMEDRAFT_57956 [Tremella mesenterica DSM 1558]EIW65679.1 hypothetical protein TREMEDRAFT_57956 [Tremella mesenterica DSM 1558]
MSFTTSHLTTGGLLVMAFLHHQIRGSQRPSWNAHGLNEIYEVCGHLGSESSTHLCPEHLTRSVLFLVWKMIPRWGVCSSSGVRVGLRKLENSVKSTNCHHAHVHMLNRDQGLGVEGGDKGKTESISLGLFTKVCG